MMLNVFGIGDKRFGMDFEISEKTSWPWPALCFIEGNFASLSSLPSPAPAGTSPADARTVIPNF